MINEPEEDKIFDKLPIDYDYIWDAVEGEEGVYKIQTGSRFQYCRIPPIDRYKNYGNTPTLHPDITYTLKVSHIFWEVQWQRQIHDIQQLKSEGCRIIPALFNDLYTHWSVVNEPIKRLPFSHESYGFLRRRKTNLISHDELHELIKVYRKPMYKYVGNYPGDIDEHEFHKLSHADKLLVIQEEACVMAYERYIVTGMIKNNRAAYQRALKVLIMKSCPLWMAVFILINYSELSTPHINYIEAIKQPKSNKKINYEF